MGLRQMREAGTLPNQHEHIQKSDVKDIVKEVARSYFSDDLSKASAAFSYYLLFSIFPLLLLFSSLVAMTEISQVSLLQLLSMLPGDIQRVISPVVTRYLGQISYSDFIRRIIMFSFFGIYFLRRTTGSLMNTVNQIYHLPNRRNGVGQLLFEILSAAGFVFAIVFSFVIVILGRTIYTMVEYFLEIPEPIGWMWSYGRYLLAAGIMFLFVLLLYYFAPNCDMKFRDAAPGTIFTLLVWMIYTWFFTFYLNNINQYDALYGSISAIMVLMLWMYMTSIILFLGFELNYVLMKRKHRNFVCKGKPWYVRRFHKFKEKRKARKEG